MDVVNQHARRYLVLVAMNLHLSTLDMQQAGVFWIHSAKVLSEKKLVDARVTHTCTRHPHRGKISGDQELLGLHSSPCSVTKAWRGRERASGASRGVRDKPSLI